MCIICNISTGANSDLKPAEDYLNAFDQAVKAMKKAEKAMLECSKIVIEPEIKKHYDRIHKKMIKRRKVWTQLQAERETFTTQQNQNPGLLSYDKGMENVAASQ